MSLPVAIVTPSYIRDLESCRLLCETVDVFAHNFTEHYLVVPDEDFAAFASLRGPRRRIVAESEVLPEPLHRLPVKWKGRRYYWTAGSAPIYGWHTQQLRKFAMTTRQDAPRVMFVDSDNLLVRPFDVGSYAGGPLTPLYLDEGAVTEDETSHVGWLGIAHRLLGLPPAALPADDFIGQMIVWDVATVRELLARIERISGRSWTSAMLRGRTFSEYMIYGAAVMADPDLRARHEVTTRSPCRTYWEGEALDRAALRGFVDGMRPDQCAIAVQSFTGTQVSLLRELAFEHEAAA